MCDIAKRHHNITPTNRKRTMDCTFQVESFVGTIWVNYRDFKYYIDLEDREWELMTEERFHEIGDETKHVTFECMGIRKSEVNEAVNRACRLFR